MLRVGFRTGVEAGRLGQFLPMNAPLIVIVFVYGTYEPERQIPAVVQPCGEHLTLSSIGREARGSQRGALRLKCLGTFSPGRVG